MKTITAAPPRSEWMLIVGFTMLTLLVSTQLAHAKPAISNTTISDAQQCVTSLTITTAEWKAKNQRLTVRGENTKQCGTVTVTNALDPSQVLGTKNGKGPKFNVGVRKPNPVPCTVQVEQDGATVQADVTNAPADCSPNHACIALGGLAYDSWHKSDAGGSGLPPDEPDADYTRCKACHGWDQLATDGGYVRRNRNAGRANAGYEDPNNCDLPGANLLTCTRSRNISTDATFGRGSSIEIPAGGRTWAEGSAVFDMVDPNWGEGAILGNRHPDLSAANPGGPKAQQLSCLTAFLNAHEARVDQVFSAIETMPADGEPLVIYTPVATADATAGEAYYDTNCSGCHGDPSDDSTAATDHTPGTGGIIGYLNQDGKFSEFMHKMHWGIPNTSMSRAATGDPTTADVANVVAHMQHIPFMELSAAQEVPAVADIMARGNGAYTLTGAGLEYNITVDTGNLSGPITAAHFHLGRVGTNGGVVRTIDFVDGQAIGIWMSTDDEPLTEALTEALLAGDVYVNVHTEANPPGEIRGQVKAVQGNDN